MYGNFNENNSRIIGSFVHNSRIMDIHEHNARITNQLLTKTYFRKQRRSQTWAVARASGYFALPSAAFPVITMAYKL